MNTDATVDMLKKAILNAKEATDEVHRLLGEIDSDAIVIPQGPPIPHPDQAKCMLMPEVSPDPIVHPGSSRCWMQLPLKITDVIEPIRGISEMLQVMLAVLDTVNPNTQLPRRS